MKVKGIAIYIPPKVHNYGNYIHETTRDAEFRNKTVTIIDISIPNNGMTHRIMFADGIRWWVNPKYLKPIVLSKQRSIFKVRRPRTKAIINMKDIKI